MTQYVFILLRLNGAFHNRVVEVQCVQLCSFSAYCYDYVSISHAFILPCSDTEHLLIKLNERERERETKSQNHKIPQQCGSRMSPIMVDGGDTPGMEGPEIKDLNLLEANNEKRSYLASMD